MSNNPDSTCPIKVTESAITALRDALSEVSGDNNFVRVYISGGGCSGLQYGMAIDDEPDEIDRQFEINGLPFVIDAVSLKYIQGSVLDHTGGGLSGAFRFDNPQSIKSCGCSQSFSVEDADSLGLDTNRYGGCSTCTSQQ